MRVWPGTPAFNLHTFQHDSAVCCVKISPDDRFIATGSNKVARVFNICTGVEKYSFDINPQGSSVHMHVRGIDFANNGDYLVTGSNGGYITVSQPFGQVKRYVTS